MKKISKLAFFLLFTAAGAMVSGMTAGASEDIRIIGESEEEYYESGKSEEEYRESEESENPEEGTDEAAADSVKRKEACAAGRALYLKMQDYADKNSNEDFASLFAEEMDPASLQKQLQAVKSSLPVLKECEGSEDFCFSYAPSNGPENEAASLCLTDFKVKDDGGVDWYSVLISIEKEDDDWKISSSSALDELSSHYPAGFLDAAKSGRRAVNLYPYFALPFDDEAIFDGAFYSLVNMVWENEDGSISFALWLSNGQDGKKWCESLDLKLADSKSGRFLDTKIPVELALEARSSAFLVYTYPAQNQGSMNESWDKLTVESNLIYE